MLDLTTDGALQRGLALGYVGPEFLLTDDPQKRHAILTRPVPDDAGLPQRLDYLADLVNAAATGTAPAQRANAALLKAAGMAIALSDIDAIRTLLEPHRDHLPLDDRVDWVEWLETIGTRDSTLAGLLDETSKLAWPTCVPM